MHWDCQDFSRHTKTCWDASRFVKKSWHYWNLLSLNMMKSLDWLRNLDKKMQKSMYFFIDIETNCQEMQKFSDLNKFLDLDQDFLVWTLMSRRDFSIVEMHFLKMSRFSRLTRQTLWQCQDQDSRSEHDRDILRPPGLVYLLNKMYLPRKFFVI